MHGKVIWKPEISEIAKSFRGIAPGLHKGGLQRHIWTPSCKTNILTHIFHEKLNP